MSVVQMQPGTMLAAQNDIKNPAKCIDKVRDALRDFVGLVSSDISPGSFEARSAEGGISRRRNDEMK